ncbi:Pentatricopeptide repeat-containing protein PNM1, mitochondrial [Vitis vinifera]|uniref:Pentatricopeptide repeat-containing protein PNM1, mitochondrial n=1 Tax=Vitis vinifera TaxID=29760 RepID=A0A438I3D2_VITVI|nr:Pentatricopeptide repeat-containing protein PNM1, mitochondrial [Vitis vinifera]
MAEKVCGTLSWQDTSLLISLENVEILDAINVSPTPQASSSLLLIIIIIIIIFFFFFFFFFSASHPNQTTVPMMITPKSLNLSLLNSLRIRIQRPVPIIQRLQLSFSHITPSPPLILQTLNTSPDAGRTVLGFYKWLSSNPKFVHSDETISFFVDYFGRRKDFKAIHEVLMDGRNFAGAKTLESAIDRLVRAGRATQVVSFFDRMEVDYGFRRDRESLTMVVSKLCEHGFASHAEKVVKNVANEIFPNETICDLLIKGWCVDGKLDEARRKKDPFRLESEAEKILVDMDVAGVPRNVETFNVLITNLCKIRKTEDAMKLFYRMGEWGCYPNETTFLVLTRSLYQAARVGEGDEMIDRMKSAGFGNALDKKAYYEFIKILCGIERIDHAMSLFSKMKEDGCKPGIKTYDLLMGKLCAHGRLDKANALFSEAVNRGVPVESKAYKLDPRFVKKPTVAKKEKKRETLPEKNGPEEEAP